MKPSVMQRFLKICVLAGGAFSLICSLAWAGDASYIGTAACLECHEELAASFDKSLHGKAWAATGDYQESGCEACHGPGSQHADNPSKETIITFGKDSLQTAKAQSDQCFKCHSASQEVALWSTGKHAKREVACGSCHSIHAGYSPKAKSPEVCYDCHLDVKLDANKQSHHPIREGRVSCNDCHNPHGTLANAELRNDSLNQLCYQCHADKRGPFMWEHPPVEENCANCHVPHGSRHKKLLTQKVPNLCQSCHASVFHSGTGQESGFGGTANSTFVARACTNCHQNVHGSWAPNRPGSRFFH